MIIDYITQEQIICECGEEEKQYMRKGRNMTLRKHMREMHKNIDGLPRSNEDLQKLHSRAHHRLLCSHYHMEDNKGNLAGPNTDMRRPSGWLTGEHAVLYSEGICKACLRKSTTHTCGL